MKAYVTEKILAYQVDAIFFLSLLIIVSKCPVRCTDQKKEVMFGSKVPKNMLPTILHTPSRQGGLCSKFLRSPSGCFVMLCRGCPRTQAFGEWSTPLKTEPVPHACRTFSIEHAGLAFTTKA